MTSPNNALRAAFVRNRGGWSIALLALLAVFGLPFANLFLYASLILGLIGLIKIWSTHQTCRHDETLQSFLVVFALLALPLLASLPDAIEPAGASAAWLRYLLFGLAGIALVRGIRVDHAPTLRYGVVAILLFWTADGLMQYAMGFNIRGFPYHPGQRLTGLFYPWPNIGYVMSVLSPLFFEAIRRWASRSRWTMLLILPWLAVVLLSSQRAAVLILLAGTAVYLTLLVRGGVLRLSRNFLITTLVGTVLVATAASQTAVVRDRFASAADMLSGNYELANKASSLRLPLWEAAAHIYQDHWINGIGLRSYPHVAPQYLSNDPTWSTTRAGHPHFTLLEVAAETGTLGLLGYTIALLLVTRRLFSRDGKANSEAMPWLLTGLLAMLPFGSTIAFFANMGTTLTWIPLGIGFALGRRAQPIAA